MTFSIRAILALTAFVAVLAALLFVFPDLVATIGLMILNPMISAALLTSAIYGRHGWRAFCIGAAGPTMFMTCFHTWLVGIVGMDTPSDDLSYYFKEMAEMTLYFKVQTVLTLAIGLTGGLTGVVVRWMFRPTC